MNNSDMLKLDLGCGKRKPFSFIGVDRFPMPGVDVVADIEKRLPFDDDSVDLLLSSHALEHLHDLTAVMKEIYRICKHGAQICIVAPYNEQKLNLANPYHICVFNEHTPRFWTDYPNAFIDPQEYSHPHASQWGLGSSDNSTSGLDLRLVRMEFFYFPKYRNLTVAEQRAMRRACWDVCDQIMYQLIVWKGDEKTPERSFLDHVADFEPFEPDYIEQRKMLERDEAQSQIVEPHIQLTEKENLLASAFNSRRRISELEMDIDRAEKGLADLRDHNHQLRMRQVELFEKIESLNGQLNTARITLAKSQIEEDAFSNAISSLRHENQFLKEQIASLTNELTNVEAMKAKITLFKAELETTNGLLTYYKSKNSEKLAVARLNSGSRIEGKEIVSELHSQVTAYRASRGARLASFLKRKDMLWKSISPAFSELKSYSEKYFRRSSRTRFVLGDDLGSMPYREYRIPYKLDSLSLVSLAIRPLLPVSRGLIGVEVVSSTRQVIAQASLPLSDINPDTPTNFFMPTPLTGLGKNWYLRVFVKDADVTVPIYELVNYPIFGRRANYSPFVCLR